MGEAILKNSLSRVFKIKAEALILGGKGKERIRSFRRVGGSGVQRVSFDDGTPRGIRTPDLLLRRQLLYPAELLAQICCPARQARRKRNGASFFRRWSG